MTTALSISDQEFSAIRSLLADISGILVAENKAYLIETRLGSLVRECGDASFSEFYKKLKYGGDEKLRDRVIDLMTTNETLWFRDGHPFTILKDELLPRYARRAKDKGRTSVRIWSAACSTGQEPYSIAMTILDEMRLNPGLKLVSFSILASDISTSALRLAKHGRYESIAIKRGLPLKYRDRYFRQEGRVWTISDEVQQMVTLKKSNLMDSFAAMGQFDMVMCRNVAIYFSDALKKDLYQRLARSLFPDGVLFLGAAESLANYSSEFEMQTAETGFYYRLRSRDGMGVT